MSSLRLMFFGCIALFSVVHGRNIKFIDCGSQNGQVIEVNVIPCDKEPCTIHRGSNVTIEVMFQTSIKSQKAILGGAAIIGGTKFPLTHTINGCESIPCPLEPGTVYKPVQEVAIPKSLPAIPFPFLIQGVLTGDNNQNLLCIEIRIRLK